MSTKRILVTGAATGIGKDTVKTLLERGHRVFATTYSEEQAVELRSELTGSVEVFKLDITNAEDRQKIIGLNIDVLINNAAIGDSGSLAEVDMDRVRNVFEVNVFSTFEISQVAIKDMINRGGGTVVFVSSIAGRLPMPFLMPYSMTKFALSAGVVALRDEMRQLGKGISITVIEPGAFHTGFNQSMTDEKFKWMEQESIFPPEKISKLKSQEKLGFKLFESKTTKPIVNKIVKASEAKKPRTRYVAPFMQGLFVRFLRAIGI